MDVWLIVHLGCAGAWLGCVLTEAMFERALLARGAAVHRLLADLHLKVDAFVEVPAFCGVLISGLALATGRASIDTMLGWKIAAGVLAVALNAWCVGLVWRRRGQALADDEAGFLRIDAAQHRWGAGVLVALLAAMGLAVLRRAGLTA